MRCMVDGWMAGRKEEGGRRRNNHLGAFHVCGVCSRVCVQLCAGVNVCMHVEARGLCLLSPGTLYFIH